MHHKRRDRHRGDRDRREVLYRIVAGGAHDEGTDDKLAGGAREQRVAIGLSARHRDGCDHSASATLVLDDDVTELRLHPIAPKPGHDVHDTAGGTWNDKPD